MLYFTVLILKLFPCLDIKMKEVKRMKKILSFVVAMAAVLAMVKPAAATVTCWTDYGGSEVCNRYGDLYLDKRVSLPRTNNEGTLSFKDNLNETDERYVNGQEVVFEIVTKNIGDATISKVTVKDYFPAYLDFVSTERGSWDSSARVVTYEIGDLEIGEVDTVKITAKVNTDVYACVYNKAYGTPNSGNGDSDEARLCMGERVLGVTTMPSTGIESMVGAAFLAALATGLYLVKKNRAK